MAGNGVLIVKGWTATTQPGDVTVITIEDREAAEEAVTRAESARDAAEDYAADAKQWAQSGGGSPGTGTGGGGNLYTVRMVSGAYPKRNAVYGVLPGNAVVEWEGPTPPTLGGDYAIAGRDRWLVVDVT